MIRGSLHQHRLAATLQLVAPIHVHNCRSLLEWWLLVHGTWGHGECRLASHLNRVFPLFHIWRLLKLESAWVSLQQLVFAALWDHEMCASRVEIVHEVMRFLLIFEVLLQSSKLIMMISEELRILLSDFNGILPGKIYGLVLHLHYTWFPQFDGAQDVLHSRWVLISRNVTSTYGVRLCSRNQTLFWY